MVYHIQNYWVFGLFPSSGILGTRKHDVSETGWWKRSKNPVILNVIHHRQNPLESNCSSSLLTIAESWLQIAFFWNVTQYSLVNRYQYFRETCSLHLHFYSEDACSSSSKTLVPTYQTTQQHIAEDCNLNIHCENLKSPDWISCSHPQ
jgi:hypothetical protein